nr:ribonuclease H-like domain-containing protein [Tanacetum cinerariifolium]
MAQPTAKNHAKRGTHKHYAQMTLPNPQRHVVPTAVLTQSKLVPINAVRPVSTAVQNKCCSRKMGMETKMPNFRPCFSQHKGINEPQKGNPQHALKDKGVIDSGCSRHMIGNISYLSYFKKLNGGYVAFGGNPKGAVPLAPRFLLVLKETSWLSCFKSDDSVPTSLVNDRYKSGEGYHVVPPPYIRTFMTLKPDLVFHDAPTVSKTVPNVFNVKPSTTKPTKDMSQSNRPSALIIEDWVSDSKDESKGEPMPTQKAPSFIQISKYVKTPRTSVKTIEHPKQAKNLRIDNHKSRDHKHRWNRKACFVCNILNHLIKDCDYYERQMGNPQQALKDKGVIDSGCSRHMTGNISYLFDFEEINGGYVAFGGNPKGGKITCKEKKNRTLIEAATTMLADSLLPIPFWAEAVNTACYVQNRVLVTKPHNKTPYELLLGKTLCIGFMRSFGCPVTILNTLDPLGKFDDADATFDVKENENEVHVSPSSSNQPKKHDEKAKREAKRKSPVDLSTGVRDLRDEFEEFSINNTNRVNTASAPVTAVGLNPTNNTNSFNAASPSNNSISLNFEIGRKSSFVDPDMHALEEIVYSDDEEDVGAEANFSNLETNISVSHILTTRVHKDHHVSQIIGELTTAPQTRSTARMVKEQGGLNQINNDDFHTLKRISIRSTLIEAARTMLADSLLPILFWAEAVNTACYVQNKEGSVPTWLFDIDTLTKTMLYKPVTTGNQSNPSAGVQEQFDVEKAGEEIVQQYMFFPVWSSGSTNPQNTDGDAAFEGRKPESEVNVSPSSKFKDFFDNSINEDNAAGNLFPVVGKFSTNNTNTFSATGPSNVAASLTQGKYSCIDTSQLPDDPNMPELEDITYSDDENDVGAEADFNNLETSIT